MKKKIEILGLIFLSATFFILPLSSLAQQPKAATIKTQKVLVASTEVSGENEIDTTETKKDKNNGESEKSLPTITTDEAESVTKSSVILPALFDNNKTKLSIWFEWGTTLNFGKSTTSIDKTTENGNITEKLTGLTPGTIYYYRAVGQDTNGITKGTIYSFVTLLLDETNAFINDTRILNSDASQNNESSVKLDAEITTQDVPTNYWFEWGENPDFLINSTPIETLNSKNNTKVSTDLTDLPNDSIFYFRTAVQNKYGIVRGYTTRFWTTNPKPSNINIVATALETQITVHATPILIVSFIVLAILLLIKRNQKNPA